MLLLFSWSSVMRGWREEECVRPQLVQCVYAELLSVPRGWFEQVYSSVAFPSSSASFDSRI